MKAWSHTPRVFKMTLLNQQSVPPAKPTVAAHEAEATLLAPLAADADAAPRTGRGEPTRRMSRRRARSRVDAPPRGGDGAREVFFSVSKKKKAT